jgi:hypothetical protein
LSQTESTSLDGTKNHVMVLDPSTTRLLSGPHAPTEAALEEWLKEHPTYHVVLPGALSSPKFNK